MREYEALFFWLGGVIADTIPELTFNQLGPEQRGHEAIKTKQEFRNIAEELALGRINPQEYCKRSIQIINKPLDSIKLEKDLLNNVKIHQPVLETIGRIPKTYKLWLISDFPKDWLDVIYMTSDLSKFFQKERIVVTSECKLPELTPMLFYHLPWKAGLPMDKCLIIDGNTTRAVDAMRNQLSSIIYVYPRRLMLELALQKVLIVDADVMHPTSSERIEIL